MDPVSFWDQSPRSFVTIMKGAAKAAARRADENTMQAYQVLQFYGLAMGKKLKPLSHYLLDKPKKRVRKQSNEEMFAILQQFAAGGAPLSIREIN